MRLALLVLLVPSIAMAQPRALEVRSLGGSCGETTRDVPAASLRASANMRGEVTIAITSMRFYCAPAPRFDASVRDDGTIVLVAREPEAPVARCTCAHDVRLRLRVVPPGIHRIEVRFRDEVLATGEVGVANVRRR
ncbi:hypothetical protein [Sandaracinus amylolyticus]|uniref:Lipoprotein n=1 Tax=Sandaracinus amylolyticus TaxID=927083 RepID=A0A0F6WAC9_9BACT|nr:hypothetical protein [Sandaracinus amylolyticus]AKF11408.1 hypothetical protein DB32_008557 [Sandaracinus amylolyticus]